ncbi:MAG: YigZ family protein [Haliscomenobacter sp.]|nr:YigZ family protein [Haliscomenobacter sp.]
MEDTYRTIESTSAGDFRDRGSKFLAYAYPIGSETDCPPFLEALRKEHPKARHYCYAYRIGMGGLNFRANDDGEPSGTAGRPILGQIDRFGLTNVFVVVVRYFGGTLLGASGLINAYRSAAEAALSPAVKVDKLVEKHFRLEFGYALMSDVMQAVKKLHLSIVEQQFGDSGEVVIGIRKSQVQSTLVQLIAQIGNLHQEEAEKLPEIEGLKIVALD